MKFRTIIEPFRIKMVEPITMSSEAERKDFLKKAYYNPFRLRAEEVIIDFLTDSGTSAMSAAQWAGIMLGDESYAGAKSWFKLESRVKELTTYPYVLPTHQGRAGERILYGILGGHGKVFLNNTHFDTTRANIEYTGAIAIDCPKEFTQDSEDNFRGNMDLSMLKKQIKIHGSDNIPAVILTVTNNTGGGQPVSMANAKAVSTICKEKGILFILDCCRIAENAYFIKHHEEGYGDHSYEDIAREMFELADGAVMSAKKDGLVNMGGFIALKDKDIVEACRNMLIITEGYITYGGLSGRDMEALTIGLKEVFDPAYLEYRIKSTTYLGLNLREIGIPSILPTGGHAVYVDARAFYDHIPVDEYPGQTMVCELFKIGGIRSCEVGSVMFGRYDSAGKLIPHPQDLVRLAIPRRVYTQSHIDYVIEVFAELVKEKKNTKGYKITWEPEFLRHFTARFEPL